MQTNPAVEQTSLVITNEHVLTCTAGVIIRICGQSLADPRTRKEISLAVGCVDYRRMQIYDIDTPLASLGCRPERCKSLTLVVA